jgi:hypothetical protein
VLFRSDLFSFGLTLITAKPEEVFSRNSLKF